VLWDACHAVLPARQGDTSGVSRARMVAMVSMISPGQV
jgi:hypothetical protein